MSLVLVHLLWNTSPWQQRLSFTCTIFSYLRKSLHRSSKILDEHVQHVGGIYSWTRSSCCALVTACSVVTISLSRNGCSLLNKPVWWQKTRCHLKALTPFRQSLFSPHSRRQKEDLLAGQGTLHLLVSFIWDLPLFLITFELWIL